MAFYKVTKKQEGGGGGSSNILKGATDPTSAVGSNGEIYLKYGGNPAYQYDEDLGGYCDKDYYVYDAGTYLARQSYEFRKTYDGGAISVYWHSTSGPWYGPTLISTVANNIAHSNNPSPIGSAVIDGVTWYLSNDGGWSQSEDPNHAFPILETNYTPDGANIENAIRAVLTASGYTSGQLSGTYITNSYLKKNNAWQNLIGSDVNDVLNVTEPTLVVTGSFTTGSTTDSVVEIDCGFEPDFIKVLMDFGNSQTTAYYLKTGNEDNEEISVWDLRPTEGAIYQIFEPSGFVYNETGICEITTTGFKYKAHGSNTTSKACTYQALKFQDGSTPRFDEDAFYQYGTWLHPEDMTMTISDGAVDTDGSLLFSPTTGIAGISTDDIIDEGSYRYVFFVENVSSTSLQVQYGASTPGYDVNSIIGTGTGRQTYAGATLGAGKRSVYAYDINHSGGNSGVFIGMYPTGNNWKITKILRIPIT